jgi:hypothetical protein
LFWLPENPGGIYYLFELKEAAHERSFHARVLEAAGKAPEKGYVKILKEIDKGYERLLTQAEQRKV